MTIVAAVLSALHLLALAIGLPAVVLRARALAALRGAADSATIKRALVADGLWGLAAALWILTGPARAFGPLEKGTAFYLGSPLFHAKLGLFLLVFALELRPMIGLIGWRRTLRAGRTPDLTQAPLYATLSWIEAALVIVIVFVASLMARAVSYPG